MARLGALAVVHPFPSALDAAVTGIIGLLAGGSIERSLQLAAAMLLLQFAIGAVNDWADAPIDAIGGRAKPIPRGVISRRQALTVALACAAVGLLLAGLLGPATLLVALVGLGAGVAYDLGLKRTPWAGLAFATGFALLPLFAWLGSVGSPPPFLGWIFVLALPAGASVSLGNGLVDVEGDAAVGRSTPAVRLGSRRAHGLLGTADALVFAGAAIALFASIPSGAAAGPGRTFWIAWTGVVAGAFLVSVGWRLSGHPSRPDRLVGWRVQAVGLAVLAGAWFLGMS